MPDGCDIVFGAKAMMAIISAIWALTIALWAAEVLGVVAFCLLWRLSK